MNKNKIFHIVVALTFIICVSGTLSYAEDTSEFVYNVVDGGAVITKYTGGGGEVIVPSEIDGNKVIAIGERAFQDINTITKVTLSEGIERIEEMGFSGANMKEVILPDSLVFIGDYAFSYCVKLENIRLSDNLEYIGTEAFGGTYRLKQIALPDSLATMGGSVFRASGIKTVKIPSAMTQIPGLTFLGADIIEISIPATVKEIGEGIFSSCGKLKKVTFEGEIEKISRGAFENCNKLEVINIPNSVTEIGENAFLCCFKLTFNELPSNLKVIGNAAFAHCIEITELLIPAGVEKIGERAFASMDKLEFLDLNNVKEIGEEAFGGCDKLKQVIFGTSVNKIKRRAFSLGMSAEDIYVCYRGTKAQWKKIKFSDYNGAITSQPVHYGYTEKHNLEEVITKATLSKYGTTINKCKKCDYKGNEKIISRPDKFKLTKTEYAYDKNVKKPGVTVTDLDKKKLKEGTDYTVSYEKGRKLPGKYTVKITFKGKYTGTVKRYFTIKPEKINNLSATQTSSSITLKWKKVTGSDGYAIYMYDTKKKSYKKVKSTSSAEYKITGLEAGKAYKFKVRAYTENGDIIWGKYSSAVETSTKPATVTLSKLTAGSKQLTATWKTVSGATGYEVMYSTSKKFTKKTTKTVTIKKAKTKKTTIKKLSKGKKYYVKVRAYKTVSGKKIYGAYSAVKNIKVK